MAESPLCGLPQALLANIVCALPGDDFCRLEVISRRVYSVIVMHRPFSSDVAAMFSETCLGSSVFPLLSHMLATARLYGLSDRATCRAFSISVGGLLRPAAVLAAQVRLLDRLMQ